MEDTILIVDDDPGVLRALNRALAGDTYIIHTAESGADGLTILKEHDIKIVISDEKMPGMSGTEFLTAARQLFPDTVRILLTGHASLKAAMKAVNKGEIYRFFSKPWDNIELKQSIHTAIEKYDLEQENRRLLSTIKDQAIELKVLEKRHPGISRLKRDKEGNLILPETSDEDLKAILKGCEID